MSEQGKLTVYYGPMKSGKSESMLQYLRRAEKYADRTFKLFRPEDTARSHDITDRLLEHEFSWYDLPKDNPELIFAQDHLYLKSKPNIIAFDEAQFFHGDFELVVKTLLENSYDVCAAGLNLDFRGMPFGKMPQLIAMADERVFLHSWCDVPGCSNVADRTQRLVDGQPALWAGDIHIVGDKQGKHDRAISYEARCREHHIVPDMPLFDLPEYDCF